MATSYIIGRRATNKAGDDFLDRRKALFALEKSLCFVQYEGDDMYVIFSLNSGRLCLRRHINPCSKYKRKPDALELLKPLKFKVLVICFATPCVSRREN